MKKDEFKYGDCIYKLDYGNHKVESPKKLPDSVFKYYSNNGDNKDAILNNYLFCSHPYHFNDSVDSTNILWDFSNLTEKIFNGFFKEHENNLFIKDKSSYEEDKKNDFKVIKTAFWNIVTDKAGIISLSENPLHSLMWAHYSSEKGFMIEFDRVGLTERFKKYNPLMKNYVFMPIQYVNKLEQIDFFLKNFTTPDIPFLYSINIKKNDWKYENEWRLVCYSDSYGIPNSIRFPEKDIEGKQERKLYYDKGIIKSFTLGKYFFNGSNLSKIEHLDIFHIKGKCEMKFVNYIYNNFNDYLFLSEELEIEKEFKRKRIQIRLIKLEDSIFQLTRV